MCKLLVEKSRVPVEAPDSSSEPLLSLERYSVILQEIHHARLQELQAAHDCALYEGQRLKQKQQSGTQQHLVVSEKRRLASLIGKTHRARKKLINDMAPFVRYLLENTEQHSIPANWKAMAREGTPYWCTPMEGESGMAPSTAEKNNIVESYLKRQRAWEQVTEILPRELVDAMRFFGDVEKRAIEFINTVPQSDGDYTTCMIEMRQYSLGCLAVGQDIFAKARECRLKCRNLWRMIEMDLQSERLIEITTISGEAGGVRENQKVDATLPILRLSLAPHEELLQEVMQPVQADPSVTM
jgi:hypothetical protein